MVVLCRGDVEVVSWPVTAWRHRGLAVIDDLARVQLAARRLGWTIRLRYPSVELSELIELAGLAEVLQTVGEPEEGEELGVEKVVMPDDPVA